MHRRWEFDAAAHVLARAALADPTGAALADLAGFADAINAEGWTLERSAPRGHVLRREGVTFDSGELAGVIRRAAAIVREPGG